MADEKRKVSPLMFLPPFIFVALAALFLVGMYRDNPDEIPSTRIGKPAPALDLVAFEGEPLLTDAVLREPGVKLVNFWGTWCVACRAEHPTLLKMAEMGVTIHGINYNDKRDHAVEYLARDGNPFTALGEDKSNRNNIDWGVYGAPETFVIDAKGVIHLRYPGPITEDVFRKTILPAMQAAEAAGQS